MPPFKDKRRRELEAQMSKQVGRLNERTRRKLLKLIGDPPSMDNLTGDVWREILLEFEQVLTPELEKVFIESAQHMAQSVGGFGVNFDKINESAVQYARRFAGTTARTMVEYRRQKMGEDIAQYFENKIDRDTLFARVNRLYGPAKAEEIAITEITRVAVEGERPVIDELTNQGVMLQKVWLTVRDRKVCPICEPLDGVFAQGIGFDATFTNPNTGKQYYNPPAHTRCRCGIRYEYVNTMESNR